MAVSKSRRISGWILIALLVISAAITLLFFLGGTSMEEVEGYKAYNQTSILLYWTYFLVGATLLTTLIASLASFFRGFKQDSKRAMRGLYGFVGLIVLLVVTYSLGNGDVNSLTMLSDDSNKYMTPFWLKISDMVIFSSVVLLVLNVLVMLGGAIRSSLIKKK